MNYINAKELVEKNQHLINKMHKGSVVEDIVIVPTDQRAYAAFLMEYLYDYDAESAIMPYRHMDVDVVALFLRERADEGFLFYCTLKDLSPELVINK